MTGPSNSPLSKIARYEILREIGRGGMAVVYLARDPNFQRDVAIKVLPRDALHDSTLYQRFQREAHTIASLEHPAIVPVYDFGEENGQPFLVMRYLSGGSLATKIKAGPIPVAECAKILGRIGGALDAAHAKGVVHRDLKPANILFDQYGEAYLSDFGIAQLSEATSPLTGSGILGTPAYMSPEQIRGDGKVDGRADIYALGIVLFEMLTGKTPFKADTPAQMMMAHLANPTPRLPENRTDLPEGINTVLIRAMAKDPEFRFQKASELGSLLAAIASGQAPAMTETVQTNAYLKETSATRIDAEPGPRRKTGSAPEKGSGESSPKKPSGNRWGLAIAGLVALCLCMIAGSAGGYALYKNPDAYMALLGQKGTTTSTITPANNINSTIELNPAGKITPPNNIGSSSTVDSSALVGDKFSVSIGDEISNGVPGPGAGNIESPGVKDIYTFTAQAGQTVYFQLIENKVGDSPISRVDWKAIDEVGYEVFNSCFGCGDPGDKLLEHGGVYTIIVGKEDSPGIGTYKFKLWNVPPPDQFSISIGDEISNGLPGPGAGNIESPGVNDIYTFKASAGQTIFFQLIDNKVGNGPLSRVDWKVIDERGYVVFSTCFGCGDPGDKTLDNGGTYTLTVGQNNSPGMGTYKFKLWNVPPPDRFAISIGDEVSNGIPGPGAGNIESPGAKDIYTFTAQAGQTVFFQLIESKVGDGPLTRVDWNVIDERGYEVFNSCFGCGDPGNKILEHGGTYTITVGNETSAGMGTYKFKFWSVSSKMFAYQNSILLHNDPGEFLIMESLTPCSTDLGRPGEHLLREPNLDSAMDDNSTAEELD